MYRLAVRRNFIAQHFLIGGDFGAENTRHSHHYVMELELAGTQLNELGYLVDIVAVETELDALVARYRDTTLNELEEFAGLNPSIEHFARILCTALAARISEPTIERLKVTVWENDIASASYELSA